MRRQERRAAIRSELGLRADQIALLFVANELERKGYATILSALQRLRRPDLRLLVAGRADSGQAHREARAAGVAEQVMMSAGPTSDVSGFHRGRRSFCASYPVRSILSGYFLEALGSGLPVITTRCRAPGTRFSSRRQRRAVNGSEKRPGTSPGV